MDAHGSDAPAEALSISAPRGGLYVEVAGVGPPVLFIHGYLLSGRLWRPTAGRLAPAGWRCIMPDLRGHGRSDVPREAAAATIAAYTDDMVAVLDALGERRPVVLVGLSMGGIIGMDLFQRYRERLRALVIVCARANAEPDLGVKRWNGLIRLIEREGSRAAADAFVDRVFAVGVDPRLRDELYRDILAMDPRGAIAAARALCGRPDARPTLAAIDCPTLVVAGEEDSVTSPDTMRDIHQMIPGSRFAVIPKAAHLPPSEQPEAFAEVLLTFLGAVGR